jgi:hypothetical protein
MVKIWKLLLFSFSSLTLGTPHDIPLPGNSCKILLLSVLLQRAAFL